MHPWVRFQSTVKTVVGDLLGCANIVFCFVFLLCRDLSKSQLFANAATLDVVDGDEDNTSCFQLRRATLGSLDLTFPPFRLRG